MKDYKVDWVEQKSGKKGPYRLATLTDETGSYTNIFVFSNNPEYENCTPGSTVKGEIQDDGKFKTLKSGNLGPRPASIPFSKAPAPVQGKISDEERETSIAYHASMKIAMSFLEARAVPFALPDLYDIQKQLLDHWHAFKTAQKDKPPF